MMAVGFDKPLALEKTNPGFVGRKRRKFLFDFKPHGRRLFAEHLRALNQVTGESMGGRQLETRIAADGILHIRISPLRRRCHRERKFSAIFFHHRPIHVHRPLHEIVGEVP